MATYTTLRNGSSGSEVKKLQQALVDAGYSVGKAGVDGIYGSGTASAVKAYQQANGLSVDGIAGNQTLGKLYGGSTASTTPTAPTAPQSNTTFKYEDFKYTDPNDNDIVKQANAMLQEQMAKKPGEYTSPWQSQLNDTLNKILNREEFSYDLNGDVLYQQYKDQYTTQGKQAMMDTMGQATAMTGGYGNSYAQTVGQQTYQGYLQQLNDRVPELYQLALARYNQEGQDLKDQATLIAQQDEMEYGRHRDKVSDYYTELDYLTGRADTAYDKAVGERDFESGLWADKQKYNFDTATSDKKYAYDTAMAMLSMGVTPTAQMLADAGISASDANALVKKVKENEAKADTTGGNPSNPSDPSNPSNPTGYNNGGYSADIVKQAQNFVGASADGKWGADSTAKAKAKGYNSIAEVVAAMGNPGGNPLIDKSEYDGWTALDWNSYFAQIRQTEGKAAAEKELEDFTRQGIIPKQHLASAGVGARGSMGH